MRGRVAVVMTMGALHEGHAALLRAARAEADHVVVTIFVNPLQFGPNEDFTRYPRTLDADLEVLRAERADAVFVPGAEEIYPQRPAAGTGGSRSAGDGARGRRTGPGHFDGVLTVVLKLLNLTRADVAYFGEKDYQQLTLIRSMVDDLNVPTEIVGVPTVREPDGLARSSRNRFLSTAERDGRAGAVAGAAGRRGDRGATGPARPPSSPRPAPSSSRTGGGARLPRADRSLPGPGPGAGPARLLVAAKVGETRLIDNTEIELR